MKSSHPFSISILCIFIFAAGFTSPDLQAASPFDISITNEGYDPQVAHIPVGTLVTWTNLEGVHTTTSRDGLWDSGVLVNGENFSYEFNEVGLYEYYDTIHTWPSGVIEVVHSLASMDIYTDKTLYASGDTMIVGLDITNPGDAVQVGIYVWLEGPGGSMTWIVIVPSILLPAGYSYSDEQWLTVTLPPLPRGEYSLKAAFLKVPEMDLISLDSATWTFGRVTQSDWSGGPGASRPSPLWGKKFDSTTDAAWRSIRDQLSISAQPITTPVESVIAYDADRPNSVVAGDLNNDGRDEVITTDPVYDIYQDLGAIYWWEPPSKGRDEWIRHYVSDDFYGACYADTADVDSDGDQDVIAAAYYGDGPELGRNGRYAWFENLDGVGSSWKKYVLHPLDNWFWGACYIDAGDMDGDGDIDLIGASQLTDGVYEQEGDIVWFENLDGEGREWGQHDLDLQFPNASEAHLVDLDGDDDLDVVGTYSHEFGPSSFAWWENVNGDGSEWTKRFIPFEFWGSGYVSAGDIDNDGDNDLIGGGYNTSQVGFWENLDGTGTSWQAWYVTVMPSGRGVELIDVEGDGDLDALMWNTYWVSWVENLDGQGFAWNARIINFWLDDPWAAMGDVNGDGKLELLATSLESGSFPGTQARLYDVIEFKSVGELTGSILDGDPVPGWGNMTWDDLVQSGASCVVEVRASDDDTNMGPFMTVPYSGYDLGALIDPGARYLQYRVNFMSSDPEVSPVLRELDVEKGDGF
ncbi:MAG: FG-GAP-like repeat-containing protein [Planctomycetota bacterium]